MQSQERFLKKFQRKLVKNSINCKISYNANLQSLLKLNIRLELSVLEFGKGLKKLDSRNLFSPNLEFRKFETVFFLKCAETKFAFR